MLIDGLGNRLIGDWSAPFQIEPPLRLEAVSSDRPAPQAALTVPADLECCRLRRGGAAALYVRVGPRPRDRAAGSARDRIRLAVESRS